MNHKSVFTFMIWDTDSDTYVLESIHATRESAERRLAEYGGNYLIGSPNYPKLLPCYLIQEWGVVE